MKKPILEDRYLRLRQIIGDPKTGLKPIVPVGKSTWWAGIRDGRFPAGIKLSGRVTVWRASDVFALIERLPD